MAWTNDKSFQIFSTIIFNPLRHLLSFPLPFPVPSYSLMICFLASCFSVSEKCSNLLHNHTDVVITDTNVLNSLGRLMMLSNFFLFVCFLPTAGSFFSTFIRLLWTTPNFLSFKSHPWPFIEQMIFFFFLLRAWRASDEHLPSMCPLHLWSLTFFIMEKVKS